MEVEWRECTFYSMRGNWCRDFEACRHSVLKTYTGTRLFSSTNRLLMSAGESSVESVQYVPPSSTWPHLNSDVGLEKGNINRTVSVL